MFTDMVGYTALGQRNESLSLALVEEQRKLIRPILSRHNGREIKTIGDAFFVEFFSALEAVRCAYDIQRAIREFNFSLPDENKLHLRIGVHLGDVVESGGDLSGDAVNVASRVEPLAEDGGICLSQQVYESVRRKFELEMQSMGRKSLKNVEEPLEIYKIIMPWFDKGGSKSDAPLARDRIAILPFRNMSPDPNDEYFAEGMTEELISTVSKINELTVISRTSVMRYRDSPVPISQVGEELKVGSVLEGSVRKAGNKVRITAQLIDVQNDGHLWSQSYDKELTDIFAIQGDIAEQIANSLKVELVSGELKRIRGKLTVDPGAFTLYMKGRHYWNERTEEGTRKALRYFEAAVKADPDFAMAYSGLADCYNILSDYNWMPPSEALSLAKAYATEALEIDDSLAEAHASLGLTLSNYTWDLSAAERELKRAIELKPNYAPAYHWFAVDMFYMRRYAESVEAEKKALELDPYARIYNMASTNQITLFGKAPEALERYDTLIEEYPDFAALRYWKSICLVLAGKHAEAVEEAKRFVAVDASPWSNLHLAWVYACTGSAEEARSLLAKSIATSEQASMRPTDVALVKLALGDREEGYAWLERAYAERDPQLLYFNGFPWTKEFRKDPKWVSIEAKFGFKSASD
jgi:TolB-like protein/tetratricopeptide (TPR) repeat protein